MMDGVARLLHQEAPRAVVGLVSAGVACTGCVCLAASAASVPPRTRRRGQAYPLSTGTEQLQPQQSESQPVSQSLVRQQQPEPESDGPASWGQACLLSTGTEQLQPQQSESQPVSQSLVRQQQPEPESDGPASWTTWGEGADGPARGGWGAVALAASAHCTNPDGGSTGGGRLANASGGGGGGGGSGGGWGVHLSSQAANTDLSQPHISADVSPTTSGWAGDQASGQLPQAGSAGKIRRQIHHYFSNSSLLKEGDRVMQLIVADIAQGGLGFVELSELITFSMMQEHLACIQDEGSRLAAVVHALRESTEVEISLDERAVRRRKPLPDPEQYRAAIAAVEQDASLVELSDPTLDLALQELRQRQQPIALFHRALLDLHDGTKLYLSGDFGRAKACFWRCFWKMVSSNEGSETKKPAGLGHPSIHLTVDQRHKRETLINISKVNRAACLLSIGRLDADGVDSIKEAHETLATHSRLLDVRPRVGEGRRQRDVLDDATTEMLTLKASAQLIAAEATVALGRLEQAKAYLSDCERVIKAASKRWGKENAVRAWCRKGAIAKHKDELGKVLCTFDAKFQVRLRLTDGNMSSWIDATQLRKASSAEATKFEQSATSLLERAIQRLSLAKGMLRRLSTSSSLKHLDINLFQSVTQLIGDASAAVEIQCVVPMPGNVAAGSSEHAKAPLAGATDTSVATVAAESEDTAGGYTRFVEELALTMEDLRDCVTATAVNADADFLAELEPQPPELEPQFLDSPTAPSADGLDSVIQQAFANWTARAGHDPVEHVCRTSGEPVGAAVRAACVDAIAFAASDTCRLKIYPCQLISAEDGVHSTPLLEGDVRNSVRRFAEQVLRLQASSVGGTDSRHLELRKPQGFYDLQEELDADSLVMPCRACGTLGEMGVHFTRSQWNKRGQCKVCTQRQALERKRALVEELRAQIADASEDTSALRYLLVPPTKAAIEACKARKRKAQTEEDKRGLGLKAGFLDN